MKASPVLALSAAAVAILLWLTWSGDEDALSLCLVENFGEGRDAPVATADGRVRGVEPGSIPGEMPPNEVLLDRPASDPLWGALRAWEVAHPAARVRYASRDVDPRRTCAFTEALQGFVGEAPCVDRHFAGVTVRGRRPWSRDIDLYVRSEAPDHPFAYGKGCRARRTWWGWGGTLEDSWVT